MEGYHGALEITDLVELVHRNKYRPNIRWITSRWGPRQGAPAGTVTLLVGDWLSDTWGLLKRQHQEVYNVPIPFIPEKNIGNPVTDRVIAMGWRDIVKQLVIDRVIRPSREVERLLGQRECDGARHQAGIV